MHHAHHGRRDAPRVRAFPAELKASVLAPSPPILEESHERGAGNQVGRRGHRRGARLPPRRVPARPARCSGHFSRGSGPPPHRLLPRPLAPRPVARRSAPSRSARRPHLAGPGRARARLRRDRALRRRRRPPARREARARDDALRLRLPRHRVGAAGVRLRDDLPHLGRRRAPHAGAPVARKGEQGALARQLRPRDALRVERRDLAIPHRLPLPHVRRGRRLLGRSSTRSSTRSCTRTTRTRTSAARCATSVSRSGRTGASRSTRRGPSTTRWCGRTSRPTTLRWDAIGRLVYGADHPLALSSGGTPEGIRALTPDDIRRFHAAHYQLANMGMVAAFPSAVRAPHRPREGRPHARRPRPPARRARTT